MHLRRTSKGGSVARRSLSPSFSLSQHTLSLAHLLHNFTPLYIYFSLNMHFSLDTIAAFLAASTTMAVAFPVAAMTDSVVKRGFGTSPFFEPLKNSVQLLTTVSCRSTDTDNSLFVSFCGAPLSGEESSLYLGNGVAPYSLVCTYNQSLCIYPTLAAS